MPKLIHYTDFQKWTFGLVLDFKERRWGFLHLGPLVVGLRRNVPSPGDFPGMWLDEAARIPQKTLDTLHERLQRGDHYPGAWASAQRPSPLRTGWSSSPLPPAYTPMPAAPSEQQAQLVRELGELVEKKIFDLQDTLRRYQMEHNDLLLGIYQIRQERIQEKLDALRKRRTDDENSCDD
jgi:hypothetical protein